MGVEKKTIYTCDRCGRQSENSNFNDGARCGSGTLSIEGNWGGKSYDGAWGGSRYDEKKLLCFLCADDFLATFVSFMASGKSES